MLLRQQLRRTPEGRSILKARADDRRRQRVEAQSRVLNWALLICPLIGAAVLAATRPSGSTTLHPASHIPSPLFETDDDHQRMRHTPPPSLDRSGALIVPLLP
jgi:hypothetical protein